MNDVIKRTESETSFFSLHIKNEYHISLFIKVEDISVVNYLPLTSVINESMRGWFCLSLPVCTCFIDSNY